MLTGLVNIFADGVLSNFYNTTNKKYGNDQTFTFDGGIRGKFLWWEWWTTRTSFKSQPKTKGGYDISPGGYFNAQQLVANQSNSKDTYLYVIFNAGVQTGATVYEPTHSFIPTKSALAYSGSNVLNENISDKNRVCTGETPFDSYFAPQNNEEHIHLTNENVTWLTEEIMGNPQDPSVHTRPFTIQGDNIICYSELKTYTLDTNISSCQSNTEWNVSNNLNIISQTNNSITVAPFNNSLTDIGFVSAKRNEGGNAIIVYKDVWVGKPSDGSANFRLAGSSQIFSRQWSRLEASVRLSSVSLSSPDYEYEWNIPSSQIRYADNKRIANIYPYSTGSRNIGFRLKNRCGCSNWNTKQFNVVNQNTGNTGGGVLIRIRE